MALEKFGIKEVADVRFYPANALAVNETTGKLTFQNKPGTSVAYTEDDMVLEFNTLKVSNLSITSETSDARGGKGNAKLLTWDHSREGTLTLEDAMLSLKCLQALMGKKTETGEPGDGSTNDIVRITTDSFAENYCVVGTTYARDQKTGKDHLFTFFVPNAKVSTELNLEMSADGDPTVFNMELTILRASATDSTMVALLAADNEYKPGKGETSIFAQVIGA
jgi:hypothetical protein